MESLDTPNSLYSSEVSADDDDESDAQSYNKHNQRQQGESSAEFRDDTDDISRNKRNPNQKMCSFFKKGICRYGVSGTSGGTCPFIHRKVCRAYQLYGSSKRKGCKKDGNCEYWHPLLCYKSINTRECLDDKCRFWHLKGTVRLSEDTIQTEMDYNQITDKPSDPEDDETAASPPNDENRGSSIHASDSTCKLPRPEKSSSATNISPITSDVFSAQKRILNKYKRYKQTKDPKMMFLNVEGLFRGKDKWKKVNFLRETALDEEPICIVTVESHLNDNIENKEIAISEYSLYRADRYNRVQGGVALYLRSPLMIEEENIKKFSNSTCELLILKVKELNIHIVSIYRPPKTKVNEFTECLQIIEDYFRNKTLMEKIVILGDLNFPHLKWNSYEDTVIPTISGGTTEDQIQAEKLLELTDSLFLEQLVVNPTRGNNILDLIFTNDENFISDISITKSGISDHNLITATLSEEFKQSKNTANVIEEESCSKLERYAFWSKKCNWELVTEKLSHTNWGSQITDVSDINRDLQFLYDQCFESCIGNIPEKKKQTKKYIPDDRRILMRKRRLHMKKLPSITSKRKVTETNKKIVDIEKQLLKSHTDERIRKENDAVSAILSNSKAFYGYAKQTNKTKSSIGPLVKESGELVNDPAEISEILRKQYEKAFNIRKADIEIKLNGDDDETKTNIDDFFSDNAPFSDIVISECDVQKAIEQTRINSAPGIDNVPPILLHKCKQQLLKPLTLILNKSIQTRNIPTVWKEAIITPIFKGGNKATPSNYRPVSLTSQIAKLLERIVRWYMIEFLEVNNAFPDTQHGFRPYRSTVSQLLEHYDDIIDALEENANIDIVMLDFSKAFDTINISILLQKLRVIGIGGNIAKWIGNFLISRKQKVVVNKHSSQWSDVKSGVPQGTILAPLLFLIYISDIGDNIKFSTLASYCDDSKVRNKIKDKSDGENLQKDINSVFNWTDKNLMKFNLTKFELLRIGKKQDLKNEIKYKTPNNEDISESDTVKDLGIIINKQGNFEDHMKIKISKCKKVCGMILRTFMSRDATHMMCLFKTLVIPIIDYCSIVWNPHKKKHIKAIEKIQRNFTKRLTNMKDIEYYQRLKDLRLYSMERRRERYELLYIFKTMKRLVPNVGLKWKEATRRGRVLIPPPVHKKSSCAAATMRRYSFRGKAAFLFNALPASIRNIPLDTPMDSIKRAVDKYLQTVTDEPVLDGCYRSTDAASNSLVHQIIRHSV